METIINNIVAGEKRRYFCSDDIQFQGIDIANEGISKIPAPVRQELNFMIDIDFISNSDRIENINANLPLIDFLHNPNIKVIRSEGRLLNPHLEEDKKIINVSTDNEPYEDNFPREYIDYLKETNLLVFDKETNEEYFIETSGHLAAVAETINEARRARRAIQRGEKHPLDAEFISDHINQHVLGVDIGRYRSKYYFPTVGISGGADWCCTGGDKVDDEIANLLDWYNNEITLHPIVRAAVLHSEFIRIHPFPDGNGRTARLLTNYELIKNGYPSITVKAKNRNIYIDALNTAISTGDITKLVMLFKERMIARQKLYNARLLEADMDLDLERE